MALYEWKNVLDLCEVSCDWNESSFTEVVYFCLLSCEHFNASYLFHVYNARWQSFSWFVLMCLVTNSLFYCIFVCHNLLLKLFTVNWLIGCFCLQLEEAFANQKKHEKQIQVEEERRREKERLEELKKREQERILEVSLDFFNLWCFWLWLFI